MHSLAKHAAPGSKEGDCGLKFLRGQFTVAKGRTDLPHPLALRGHLQCGKGAVHSRGLNPDTADAVLLREP